MELKDYFNSIYKKTGNLFELYPEDKHEKYIPYVVTTSLSGFYDTVLLCNMMNCMSGKSDVPKAHHYKFFYEYIRKGSRFAPWVKEPERDNLNLLMRYFDISKRKAMEIEHLYDESDYKEIELYFSEGGNKSK